MMTCKSIGKSLFDLDEKDKSVKKISYGPVVKLWKEKCKDCLSSLQMVRKSKFPPVDRIF
ncbi:hypothetical protein ER57_09780 [Smithella sp. SCADC]|nr:hypothetical protein ER57_09780 [Smithella sp. SCADC]